ncbi:MAG: methyltransferase [Gemmatimonadaceae bacterium]|nr:methyltransferase [Chitinophagaceae bacterium]
MPFFSTDDKTALEAKEQALWIAFAPVVFQSAKVLRDTGILNTIMENEQTGLTLEEVAEKVNLSQYGVRVLLESALSIGLVRVNEGRYRTTKTGYFMVQDELTRINMDFVHDVCYKGLFHLDESIKTGKPAGLKVFGEWDTIYEGLSQLPAHVQKSWFGFDHYYSDNAFPVVLKLLLKNGIKKMIDIGGNTGKWAMKCAEYDKDIHITIMDLPGQLNMAKKKVQENGLEDRISFHATNMLDESQEFPKGHDAIWMSQFLDCFSEAEITSILKRCHKALNDDGHVYILECFWDRQKFEAAAFCLHHTSLYFTALANGNSQMYDSRVFNQCVVNAGFEIAEEIDHIGLGHTLLKCKKSAR